VSDLPAGWTLVAVSQVTRLENGDRSKNYPSKQHRISSGVPFINAGHLKDGRICHDSMDYISRERFEILSGGKTRDGDVLFCLRGSLGKTALVDNTGEGAIASSLVIVRPSRALLSKYLHYFFSSPLTKSAIAQFDNGTAQPNLASKALGRFLIPLAPVAEQERIVAAVEEQFSRLDAGVAALKRARQNLKRMRAAVLHAAVTGALVRQVEGADATMRLVTELRNEARTRMTRKTAAPAVQHLGSIPDSWQVVALADLAESIDYGTSEKTHAEAKGVPVLRMGNLGWGTITYNDLKFLPREQLDLRLLLQYGDLLFNRTNSAELVGKTAVFHGYPEDIAFASYLIRVRPLPSANLEWANIVLNSAIGRRYVAAVRNQQVGQANVNGTKLAAAPIPLPPAEEQSRIIAECERLFSLIDTLEDAIVAATCRSERLRSSILSTAFAGELVAQNSKDEPASVLLERIAAGRTSSNGRRSPISHGQRATA
jgi:type I restriction enzyme, S subunit